MRLPNNTNEYIKYGIAFSLVLSGTYILSPYQVRHTYGDSMEPILCNGATVLIHEHKTPEENDMVVYKHYGMNENKTVLHRVINETDKGYVIKGDNNSDIDIQHYPNRSKFVEKDEIIGVVNNVIDSGC